MLGISQGSVSTYLKRIEKAVGHPIVRQEVKQLREAQATAGMVAEKSPVRRDGRGKIRVNNRGFHALRATFTTQALAAGVPVEMVKLITGHTLTETVLRHYFNPDEEMVLEKMQRAMPEKLTLRSEKTIKEEMVEAINGLKSKLSKGERELLLKLANRIAA